MGMGFYKNIHVTRWGWKWVKSCIPAKFGDEDGDEIMIPVPVPPRCHS